MSARIGELTFLQELAGRFKIPVPDYVVEPVNQSELKAKLQAHGAGIVKPDVLAGKRGKAGTVRKVTDYREAIQLLKKVAAEQVGGQQPRTAYMVQAVPADMELFTAITYSSRHLSPCFTVSLKGGMDIESVPEADKVTIPVDVFKGLNAYQASEALSRLGLQGKLNSSLAVCFVNQWDMFISTGMQSCEINPWRVTKDGQDLRLRLQGHVRREQLQVQGHRVQAPRVPERGRTRSTRRCGPGPRRATRARRTSPAWAGRRSSRSCSAGAPARSSSRRWPSSTGTPCSSRTSAATRPTSG